jgi:hypothetical protein
MEIFSGEEQLVRNDDGDGWGTHRLERADEEQQEGRKEAWHTITMMCALNRRLTIMAATGTTPLLRRERRDHGDERLVES